MQHMTVCVYICARTVHLYCQHDAKIQVHCFSLPPIYPLVDPPQIIQQPTPQKYVVPGSTVKFTVTAIGGGDMTYKWQWNGADLDPLPEGMSGETTSTLQIDNVKKSHQGDYRCIVSNAAGPTPSNPAQLTVRKCFYLVFLIQQYMQP